MVLDFISNYLSFSNLNFMKLNNDDFVDKMSRKFSTVMMIIFSVIITSYQFVGKPIKCWCPNEFDGGDCAYATTFCYITSQYVPVSNGSDLPSKDVLLSHRIMYYQWIPYVFIFQAFLFHLPYLVWKWFNRLSEYSLSNYIDELSGEKGDMVNNKAIKYVATHIYMCLTYQQNYIYRGTVKNYLNDKVKQFHVFTKSSLYWFYIVVKIFYLAIAVGQIYLLNYWLSDAHYSNNANNGFFSILFGAHNWQLVHRFPRMTLCQFQVYIIRFDEQIHWLQCALPINVYIEKIYIIIWTWLWVLVGFTLFKAVLCLALVLPNFRKRFLTLALKDITAERHVDYGALDEQLGIDGLLVIKLIKANTSKFYSSQILYEFGLLKESIISR